MAEAAHAVAQEAKDAGVWVFGGGLKFTSRRARRRPRARGSVLAPENDDAALAQSTRAYLSLEKPAGPAPSLSPTLVRSFGVRRHSNYSES